MFGRRSDGKPVKGLGVIEKASPHFMTQRNDAMNMIFHDLRCEPLDKWLEERRAEGLEYSYMHVIIASLVRLFSIRPQLNRFVVRGKIFQRKGMFVSLTVKKSLHDTAGDSVIKMPFKGDETLEEVKQIVDTAIKSAVMSDKGTNTDKKAKKFTILPNFLFRWAMDLVRFLDNHGALPKSLIKASPFHTSVYVTNLKSLKTDAIFHHLFNFGTTGLFVSMGKEKLAPVVENGELAVGKVMKLGIVMDERICDGFYFSRSLQIWNKVLSDPTVLQRKFEPSDIVEM